MVGGQRHVPAVLPPGKENRYPLHRRLGGPQGRSGRLRKISPPPACDPTDCRARSEWLYQRSHAGWQWQPKNSVVTYRTTCAAAGSLPPTFVLSYLGRSTDWSSKDLSTAFAIINGDCQRVYSELQWPAYTHIQYSQTIRAF